VLDVGCGTGELTLKLAKIAYPGRVLGIDNAPGRRHKYFLSPAEPQRFYEGLRARQVTGLLAG
jgi:SAM-dependent methyltransferase